MHKPGRHESVVDEQIREAQERGAFDNLPGAGLPLPILDEPDDELWWVRRAATSAVRVPVDRSTHYRYAQ